MISDIPDGTIKKEFVDIIERYGYEKNTFI